MNIFQYKTFTADLFFGMAFLCEQFGVILPCYALLITQRETFALHRRKYPERGYLPYQQRDGP